MTAFFRLVVRSGPNVGNAFPLEKEEMFIGRDLNNDIVINDPEISRRHTRLRLQGASYVVEDMGSTNGTSVNGQRLISPYVLRPGEVIGLGEHITLLYDSALPDQAATVASSLHPEAMRTQRPQAAPAPAPVQPAYVPPPRPAYAPSSQPSYIPPPQPAFTGQLPEPPEEEEEKRRKIPLWLIILIAVLLVVCVCGVALFAIDASNSWCTLFPFLFGTACP